MKRIIIPWRPVLYGDLDTFLHLVPDVVLPEGYVDHRHYDAGVPHGIHDGEGGVLAMVTCDPKVCRRPWMQM